MKPLQIMGSVVAIAAFIAIVYTVDDRWVRRPVYADEMSVVQKKLNVIEQRRIETSIEDLEDRLDSKSLSSERKGKLKERVRGYRNELRNLGFDNLYAPVKGGK